MKFEKFEPSFQERPKEESPIERIQRERREQVEKLEKFLKEVANEYKKLGIPVRDDCRIDMDGFKGVYPEEKIKHHKEDIRELKDKWEGEAPAKKEDTERVGELLERLVVAVLYKYLRDRFIVLRSSYHDDVRNKVDTVVVDKDTGNVVCAFDEVADLYGMRRGTKEEEIRRRNREKGGAYLKYGLSVERKNKEKLEIKLSSAKNLPIFYIALSEGLVYQGIKKFNPDLKNFPQEEKNFFNYFIDLIKAQIKEIEEINERMKKMKKVGLNSTLLKRVEAFKEALREFEIEKPFLFEKKKKKRRR